MRASYVTTASSSSPSSSAAARWIASRLRIGPSSSPARSSSSSSSWISSTLVSKSLRLLNNSSALLSRRTDDLDAYEVARCDRHRPRRELGFERDCSPSPSATSLTSADESRYVNPLPLVGTKLLENLAQRLLAWSERQRRRQILPGPLGRSHAATGPRTARLCWSESESASRYATGRPRSVISIGSRRSSTSLR